MLSRTHNGSFTPSYLPRCPLEIWGFIFRELPRRERVKLFEVSRACRNIAVAIPQLWTWVDICHLNQFSEPAAVSRWLSMSRELALDVEVEVPLEMIVETPLTPPELTMDLRPTLSVLHGHLHRIRCLDIQAYTPEIADKILILLTLSESFNRGVPLLEQLCIAIEEEGAGAGTNPLPENTPYFEHGFYPAPRCQRLAVPALRLPLPSHKFLSTITSLIITTVPQDFPPSVEHMLDTIAAIPCLESLVYSGCDVYKYQDTGSLDYSRVVRLPHLKLVDVTVPGCGMQILQCLEAPSLRSVRLDGWRHISQFDHTDVFPDVSALLRRLPQRAPSIRRLEIDYLELLEPQTIRWLLGPNDCAALEELRIEGSYITDAVFNESVRHGSLCRLELQNCPNITSIALKHYINSSPQDFMLWFTECLGVANGLEHLAHLSQLIIVEVKHGMQFSYLLS
jgi:hypothetical protein